MADNPFLPTASSSSGSNPFLSGGVYGSASAPKPRKRHWYNKVLDASAGVLGGVAELGYHLAADPIGELHQAATGERYDSSLDDIGKAIVDDYKHRYSSFDNFKSDPFAGLLDVATVASAFFTLGGSLAVRGAALTADGGTAARGINLLNEAAKAREAGDLGKAKRLIEEARKSRQLGGANAAASFGGLEANDSLTQVGRLHGMQSKQFLGARAAEEAKATATLGKKGVIERALTGRDALGSSGRVRVLRDGTVLTPKAGVLEGIDGARFETIPLASSPLRRLQQEAGLLVSRKLPGAPVFGSADRAGKIGKRLDRIKDETALASVLAPGAARAVRKVHKDEAQSAALYAKERGVTPHELAKHYDKQVARIEKADPELIDRDLRNSHALAGEAKAKEWHPEYATRVALERAKAASSEATVLAERIEGQKKALEAAAGEYEDGATRTVTGHRSIKAGPVDAAGTAVHAMSEPTSRVADVGTELDAAGKQLLRDQQRLDQLHGTAQSWKRVADEWKQGEHHVVAMQADRSKLVKALHDREQVITTLTNRRELMISDAVAKVFAEPTKFMMRAESAHRGMSAYITDFIKGDLGIDTRADRPELMAEMVKGRALTDEERAALFPLTSRRYHNNKVSPKELRTKGERKSSMRTEPSKKPGFSKHDTGYNFQYAQDALSPGSMFRAFNEARAYRTKVNVMQRMVKSAIPVTSADHRAELKAAGYEFVGGDSKLVTQAAELQSKLDNEFKLIFGNSVGREQASDTMRLLVDQYTKDAGEHAVDPNYFRHLTQELTRSNNAFTKFIDMPTALFRATVLNLRPAWMVSNFVGQLMLMLTGQGVIHGAREYMGEVNRTLHALAGHETAVGGIMRERAGALTSSGAARSEYAETIREANKSYAGSMLAWPGLTPAKEAWQAGNKGALAGHTLALFAKAVPAGLKGLADVMGRFNAVLTDDIPRRAAFMGYVRPMLNDVLKVNPNLTTEEALHIVLSNDEAMAHLVDRTMGDLIDFSRMNKAEREVIRRLIPFYGWLKGITLYTGRLIRDRPITANALYNVGGQYAEGAPERFGTDIPDNLRGALKVGGKIMPTNSWNVYQTPADVFHTATTMFSHEPQFGPENPLSQVNPIIKAPLEVMTGRDLFFGGPLYGSKGSQGPGDLLDQGYQDNPYTPEDESRAQGAAIASRYLAALGPLSLYMRYRAASDESKDQSAKLLQRDNGELAGQYLGWNTATLNKAKAAEAANDNSTYAIVQYDPTVGEKPGVFGRGQGSTPKRGLFI